MGPDGPMGSICLQVFKFSIVQNLFETVQFSSFPGVDSKKLSKTRHPKY